MPTNGQWIKEELVSAASKGVVIADLHKKRKARHEELGITYRKGTYSSFVRLFRWLIDLKWVEQTGEMETAFAKGNDHELKGSRIYYRLTTEGLAHSETDWYDPLATKHPEWAGSERRKKYVLPTGKPRGRPRIGPPVIKKPPKPPRVRKPKVVKPIEVVLTEKEKAKLIEDFVEVMDREPTREEIFTLFEEEVKIRRRGKREEKE